MMPQFIDLLLITSVIEKNQKFLKNIWTNKINNYLCTSIFDNRVLQNTRSVRLGVRTPGFHPGNRGSIPLRTAFFKYNKYSKYG